MAGGLAAQHAAVLDQQLMHVAIADPGADEADIAAGQRLFKPIVAHCGADHRATQTTAALPVGRQHIEQIVAIAEPALRAAHLHPIARSEEHTYELQSLMRISYAVFCLQKKKQKK